MTPKLYMVSFNTYLVVLEIDNQETLEGIEKIRSTVRMLDEDRKILMERFGGIQAAFDRVVKDAREESGWLPVLPKRLIPAFRAVKEAALTKPKQVLDSLQLRNAVVAACDCQRRTAVRFLHDLKARHLIYTFGIYGDEHMHFVACSKFDQDTVKKIHLNIKIDPNEYFAEKYGSLPLPAAEEVK